MVEEKIDISVIIPVLNEEESLALLHAQLHDVLSRLGKIYEIIFVDDGSRDGSFTVLRSLYEQDSRISVIRFRRNFGQTAAFSAGFDAARGDVVITMDADLQNDPADMPVLLEKIDAGYDVVSGWRVQRKDAFLTRRLPSQIANFLISTVTGVKLHDYGCSLKAYRRDVIKNIELYGQMHRFIPAVASWMGVQVAEVPVNHLARRFGRSKYSLTRVVKVLLDLLTIKFLISYSTRPIQIFGLIGALFLTVGTLLGAYLSTLRLFFGHPLQDRPMLLLAVLLVMLGVQLISMGLLGEMVMRTYYEARGKPTYRIREVLEPRIVEEPQEAQQETLERVVG
jgi:glycosyltransferase involved in cell wall biosynthesis